MADCYKIVHQIVKLLHKDMTSHKIISLNQVLVISIFILWNHWTVCTAEVLKPRGVSLSKRMFYVPNKEFSCIDGSNVIPFTFVNDDYCDCADGSDEPGTSACANAVFHCLNPGYISYDIPSSRVNDNICDCCDGGDEYNSTADCINTCLELGRQAVEEKQRQQELYEKGYAFRQQYSTQGKVIKENNKEQLKNLKEVLAEEEKVKTEKEAIKNEAEENERVALSAYINIKQEQVKKEEEMEMQIHQEKEKKLAEEAFKDLDLNHDNILTIQELQQFKKFDTDHDGTVSEEEAKFFLHMKDSMAVDEFINIGWMIMKPVYLVDKTEYVQHVMSHSQEITDSIVPTAAEEKDLSNEPELETEESDDETYQDEDHSLDEDDLLDESHYKEPPVFPPKDGSEAKPEEPEYDEETQKFVNIANEARKEYKESVEKMEKIKNDIRQLENDINADFGLEEEFAILKGQCFDFDDREYTYRFCPFDKASQISKSGGGDVNLGRWGVWAGPENDKYSKMKYENGQTCWNGPARSVMVLLQCGLENKLLASSEPNRCEYLFEFSTPALCKLHENAQSVHQHTEL